MDNQNETERGTKAGSPLAGVTGSATASKHRGRVLENIKSVRIWLDRLEEQMRKDDDGVIPWTCLGALSEDTTAIIYEAGMVNGAKMRGYESPNHVI